MSAGKFEVVELFKDVGGPRLGVVHMPISMWAFSVNTDNVRHLTRYAGKISIRTLILPPYLPNGLAPSFVDIETAKAAGLNKKSPYVKLLKHIANSSSLVLISMNVIEKSRLSLYISNIIVDGELGTCRFFSRKMLLSPAELAVGAKPGNKLDLVTDYYLNYTALLGEEILAPELARLTTLMGAEVVLLSSGTNISENKLTDIVSSLQIFTGGTVIHIGSILLDKSNVIAKNPTIIATPDESVLEYSDVKKSIILIPLKVLKAAEKRNTRCIELRSIIANLSKFLRHLHTLDTTRKPSQV